DFISSVAAIGSTSGGVITFAAPTVLKSSTVNYHLFGGAGERWGDFSNTIVDTSDPGIFWTFQEWAPGATNWGTQASEIIIPAANEFRWTSATDGTFGTGSNWL